MELAASAEGEDIAVTPADLIGSDGLIALTEEVTISASALSAVCRGASWASSMPTLDKPEGAQGVLSRSGLPEDRLAKRLNITREQLAQACWSLWKKSFTEERDERAGPEANAQHRGQVARIMQAEIERYIADGLNQEIPDGGR
ncbi:hypothetical protein A5648_02115 [Mycolicibacter sinensis]|uniref:Uncharacterized protein n=2 Tax=Mycolicibacter sinensis (strain JDM601) TaxID=875328 RepID=A0A1A3U025_MYCSD|nr:hypothetical protein A5648_02115 [Mycolicibacter sinensis]